MAAQIKVMPPPKDMQSVARSRHQTQRDGTVLAPKELSDRFEFAFA